MENNDIQVETLSQKVAGLRDKARNILRMQEINKILQNKFFLGDELTETKKNLATYTKEVAKAVFTISKLDKADPDYDEKLKQEEESKTYLKSKVKDLTEKVAKLEVKLVEDIKKADEKINKWEQGESKVSIQEVYDLTDNLIMNA